MEIGLEHFLRDHEEDRKPLDVQVLDLQEKAACLEHRPVFAKGDFVRGIRGIAYFRFPDNDHPGLVLRYRALGRPVTPDREDGGAAAVEENVLLAALTENGRMITLRLDGRYLEIHEEAQKLAYGHTESLATVEKKDTP